MLRSAAKARQPRVCSAGDSIRVVKSESYERGNLHKVSHIMGSATLGHSPDVRNLPDDCSMRSSQTVSKVDNRCASHHQEPIMKNSRLSTAAAVLTLLGASAAFAEP